METRKEKILSLGKEHFNNVIAQSASIKDVFSMYGFNLSGHGRGKIIHAIAEEWGISIDYGQSRSTSKIFNCTKCGKEIKVTQTRLKNSKSGLFFCSRKCKDSENICGGKIAPNFYGDAIQKNCLYCGKEIEERVRERVFCSKSCYMLHKKEKEDEARSKIIDDWKSGIHKPELLHSAIRNYLIDIRNNKCDVCGNSEWNGKQIPLEIHHIDGNATNQSKDNLQVLCLNCHGQTKNYKSKNEKRIRRI